jgi:hypothetical protein
VAHTHETHLTAPRKLLVIGPIGGNLDRVRHACAVAHRQQADAIWTLGTFGVRNGRQGHEFLNDAEQIAGHTQTPFCVVAGDGDDQNLLELTFDSTDELLARLRPHILLARTGAAHQLNGTLDSTHYGSHAGGDLPNALRPAGAFGTGHHVTFYAAGSQADPTGARHQPSALLLTGQGPLNDTRANTRANTPPEPGQFGCGRSLNVSGTDHQRHWFVVSVGYDHTVTINALHTLPDDLDTDSSTAAGRNGSGQQSDPSRVRQDEPAATGQPDRRSSVSHPRPPSTEPPSTETTRRPVP